MKTSAVGRASGPREFERLHNVEQLHDIVRQRLTDSGAGAPSEYLSTTLGNAAMAALASRQLDIKKIHGQLSPTRRAISAISTGCTVGGFGSCAPARLC